MKKILVAAIVFATTSAFAQSHMVRMYGWDFDGAGARSIDLSKESNDVTGAKTDLTNIALNYAYTVAPQIQVGGTYASQSGKDAGTKVGVTTTGLSAYYNMSDKLNDTCYFAFHYNMTSASEGGTVNGVTLAKDDKLTDMVLEYGHRFNVANAWGLNLTYAPAITYAMSTHAPDAGGDDVKGTKLAWNFLKFDLLF